MSHGRSWNNEYPGTEVRSFNVRREVRSERHMFPGKRRLPLPATAERKQLIRGVMGVCNEQILTAIAVDPTNAQTLQRPRCALYDLPFF